ncbi:hypothetical protein BDZ91DRAFT_783399 [Kalaharituber pfeilii]|nr:hypothetical protein BDZ91DRAFT_783399 [Kalaharituber pfeilii]
MPSRGRRHGRGKGKGKGRADDKPGPSTAGPSACPSSIPTANTEASDPVASHAIDAASQTAAVQPPAEPLEQYHHFVPRLVLREFADAESREQNKRQPLIKLYSMESSTITHTSVSRCYGNVNMYCDAGAPSADTMHIEKALGRLERQAANIITRIKSAQAKNETSVTITRVERNCVRKLLFVMKYRTPLFWTKYNRPLEEYNHIDTPDVLKFMREKGFNNPLEVWLHNLKTILDTPIDPEDKWKETINNSCFSHDAMWFIFNMTESFMAFCEPANRGDEFIVSESAFGIHEGPTEAIMEAYMSPGLAGAANFDELLKIRSGKGQYTEYHKMAPFSPTLLLVLRSNFLRPENKWMLREFAKMPGCHQLNTPSLFDHLQLDPPTPSYGLVTIDEFKPKDDDKFTFKLHKLSHKEVRLFNSIILNEVRVNLTWLSDEAMKTTLQEYLNDDLFRLPMQFTFLPGKPQSLPDVMRRQQLCKLLAILDGHQGQGSEIPVPSMGFHFQGMPELERRLLDSPLSPFTKGYFKLGGTPTQYMRDYLLSTLVSKMRNMIADSLPGGAHRRPYRNAAMRNELAYFSMLPCTIIYLHVKLWRMVQKRRQSGGNLSIDAIFNQAVNGTELGAEDAVANLAHKIPRKHLSNLMLHASLRKVSQIEDRMKGIESAEYGILGYFGGIVSSFWLENTPLYDSQIGASILDYNRDIPVPEDVFKHEMCARWTAKKSRLLEQKWGEDVAKFVWEWLYAGPDD